MSETKEKVDELTRSRTDKVIQFLKESRKLLMLITVLGIVFSIGFFDIDIPYMAFFEGSRRYFWVGLVFGAVVLYIPASKVVEYFYTPQYDLIVELKDDYANIIQVGTDRIAKMEVEGQNPISWTTIRGNKAYFLNKVDLEENIAYTTSMGQIPKNSQLKYYSKLEQAKIRGNLMAKIGYKFLAHRDTLFEKAKESYWLSMSEQVGNVKTTDTKSMNEQFKELIPEIEEIQDRTDLDIEETNLEIEDIQKFDNQPNDTGADTGGGANE